MLPGADTLNPRGGRSTTAAAAGHPPSRACFTHRSSRAFGGTHLLIQLRQDLIADATGQGVWIERLAGLLKTAPRFQP